MRCKACDVELHEHETRRKGLWSREYLDLCDHCFETIADDVVISTGDDVLDDSIRDDITSIEESGESFNEND